MLWRTVRTALIRGLQGEGNTRDASDTHELDARFMRAFDPDIDPAGLAADTRDFLERILRRLKGLPQD